MPRAKRTDRAEARRRYRASIDATPGDEAMDTPPEPAPTRSRSGQPAVAPAPQRPSITHAFRAAFRPVTLREDLRTFPRLLTHRSVWLPILLTVLAGLFFVVTNGSNPLVAIVATYFIVPPALGSVFLAGFLAPRSSYLIGFLVGLVSAVIASAIVLSSGASLNPDGSGTPAASPSPSIAASTAPSPSASASAAPGTSASPAPSASAGSPTPTPTTTPVAPSNSQDQVLYAFLTSPPFGMFFAATAAWYRRFLQLSNPNRGRRQPPPRRGNDGRSRGNQRSRR